MPTTNATIPATVPGSTEIAERLAVFAHEARGVYATRTEKTYGAACRQFSAWCFEHGLRPLPAEPATVAMWIDHLAGLGRSAATVSTYVAAVNHWHQRAECPPVTGHKRVKLAMTRARRQLGTAQHQARAVALGHLDAMLAGIGAERLIDVRDRALILVAADLGVRSAELVALAIADVEPSDEGGAVVTIRRGKTDQTAEGRDVAISPAAMRALAAWAAMAGMSSGPLFRAISKGGHVGGPLTGADVSAILRKRAEAAGIDPAGFSSHSFRVGLAQRMRRHEVPISDVLQHFGWAGTRMFSRYSRKVNAMAGAAVKLAQREGRWAA